MSDEIIKVLDDLSERFGVAIDWSAENVLPYAQELFQKFVNYEIWTSVFWLVICLLFIVLIISKAKWIAENDFDGFLVTAAILALIASLVVISVQALDIITALTFPEKLLFDYINSH